MKTYLLDIFNKISQFSKNIDHLSILENQLWVSLDVDSKNKKVYIFRNENKLLISDNGIVKKAKWEYLGNKSLIIEVDDNSFLLKIVFCDDDVIALKIDSSSEYAIFINETKHEKELNTLDDINHFLNLKYYKKQLIKKENEKFYFISRSIEHGPFTLDEIHNKIIKNTINPMCFIRKSNIIGYEDGLRIKDIIVI